MTRDDHVWGSRSAIQKAVRRSDIDLARTALDALWSEKVHRNWLRWRLPSIVQEDGFAMIGELPPFYSEIKGVKKDSAEEFKIWRKFLYRLCLCPPQPDAAALMYLAKASSGYTSTHPEFKAARKFYARIEKSSITDATAAAADEALRKRYGLDDREAAAVAQLLRRSAAGGMVGDQMVPIAAIVLIMHRGLPPEDTLKDAIRKSSKEWEKREKRSKPIKVEYPWYVFDMHTQVGKIALSAVARREKIDPKLLGRLWFTCESARYAKWNVRWSEVKDNPTLLESMWWKEHVKHHLAIENTTALENLKWWNSNLSTKVEGMVKYILKKRDGS